MRLIVVEKRVQSPVWLTNSGKWQLEF